MSKVRTQALSTQTTATMSEFSKACDAFQMEHGRYPGMIPESVLASNPPSSGEMPSSTELALLELMGGYRVLSPSDNPGGPVADDFDNFGDDNDPYIVRYTFGNTGWELKVDLRRIGEGPLIDGRPFAPYFTPGERELLAIQGQVGSPGGLTTKQLPDLIDGWGQSVIHACVPFQLSIDYPVGDGTLGATLLGGILLVAAVATAWACRRRAPIVTFGIGVFFVALSPHNNVFPATDVLVADRYLYVAVFGLAAIVAWASKFREGPVGCGLLAILFLVLSFVSASLPGLAFAGSGLAAQELAGQNEAPDGVVNPNSVTASESPSDDAPSAPAPGEDPTSSSSVS